MFILSISLMYLQGTFDPVTLTFSDSTTRVTRTEYDTQSRPVTVTLNYRPGLPTTADTNLQTLTYYDGAGNVIWQRDAFGRWTKTEYDALNQGTAWEYDAGGRVLTQLDPRGSDFDLTYSYDELDRQTALSAIALTAPITTTYDALGRRTFLGDATGITPSPMTPWAASPASLPPQPAVSATGIATRRLGSCIR